MLQFNAKFMIKTELRKTRLAATGGALNRMIHAKHYEKLCKFVKVTAKIPSVLFFPDTVYVIVKLTYQQKLRLP